MAGKPTISIAFTLSDDANGLKRLTMSAEDFRRAMKETVKVSTELQSKFINFAALATGIRSMSDSFNQISDTLNNLTADSRDFSKAMHEANTMAGKDAAGFKQLKGVVADLAKQIPIARDQLANGLYQTISNGVPEDNWMDFLNTSARSAVGGLANINSVVGVTSTVIKNYGKEWSAAGEIQDKIQLTAKNGVTSFEQLAQALPRVTGNAATLGVSIDELMGSFATLAGVSGNTAEVSTQLAAIFTALVKPGSEATKMAAEMGIQFDAAAIKAAGGFQNFLQQLDSSVKAYAQANGKLEQEIYGRLFGSAEALRALIPLQGELADKFAANIANMVDSAGTMDAAYNEMASTGEATARKLSNWWAAVIDAISGFIAPVQPYINFFAGFLDSAASVVILTEGLKKLNVVKAITAMRGKLVNAVIAVTGRVSKKTSLGLVMLSAAGDKAALTAAALKVALRGLLMASGVGAAIWAVTAVIEYFVGATDEATESTNKLLRAEESAKREAEQLEQMRQQEASTLTQTRAALELNISKLKTFNGTKEEEKKIVNEMNNTYGETMGYFSSVADWYNALISNSEAYCRQMVVEARTRLLANRIAQKKQEIHDTVYNEDGSLRQYSKKRETETKQTGSYTSTFGTGHYTTEVEIEGTSEVEEANERLRRDVASLKSLNRQLADAVKEAANIDFKVKGSTTRPKGSTTTPSTKSSGKTKAAKSKDVKDEFAEKKAARPSELNTLEDIDKELVYQRALRQKVAAENIAGVDAEIKRLEKLREEKERSGHVPVPTDQLKTYAELNDEERYYNWLLENGTEQERIFAQQHLNDLAAIRKEWDGVLAELDKPGDISTLDTIEKLDKAIGYVDEKIKTASADEMAFWQRTKMAYEDKRNSLQRGIEIPSMLHEADEINKLTGREYKVKVRGMGFDELTDKISELKRLLNDTDNPLTESQRKDVESLIAIYERWRKEGIDAFSTIRDGYDSIKGIGGGIEGITDALKGNANAWQTVTGIVDGFLQIYDGIKTIVNIINMLSTASNTLTAAKTGEAAATGAATGAQTAEAIASEAAAAAQVPVVAANELATTSYMKLAAAAYYAAHAYIPFAGFEIASGFVTAASSVVEGLGAVPFANGGIVSGPTVGLIGEYAGASNNPEVVAPLDKLRRMLNPVGEPVIIGGTLRASGREIVCVLANETRISSKSGKRTNIKL